jgi:hypothetical protein
MKLAAGHRRASRLAPSWSATSGSPRAGAHAGDPLVVVDQVEGGLTTVERARREEPRPGIGDQTVPVAGHRPAARVGHAEHAHQHRAHAGARVVEGEVEARGAEPADLFLDQGVGGAEIGARGGEDQATQPVEVELPDPVDPGKPAAHLGEVPLGHDRELRLRMPLLQPRDRRRRLQQVPEAGQVDDQDLVHWRCSRTYSSSN